MPVAWYPCRANTIADVSMIASRRSFHFALRLLSSTGALVIGHDRTRRVAASASLPFGRPFLGERTETFGCVIGLEQFTEQRARERAQLVVVDERGRAHDPAARSHRKWCRRRDRARDLHRHVERAARFWEPAHEPELVRTRRVDRFAREDRVHRRRASDRAR